jgi:predicted DCC family thiol-disulfide oxidoreductase YuxK
MRWITVLYDPGCSLCAFVRGWLERQRQLVPVRTVEVASDQAWEYFPELDHTTTLREITVIGDAGQVYRATDAWLVVLWALEGYRPMSHRLATPAGRPFARAAVLAAARYREAHTSTVMPGAEAAGGPEDCQDGCSVPYPAPG